MFETTDIIVVSFLIGLAIGDGIIIIFLKRQCMAEDKIKPLGFIYTNGGKVEKNLNDRIYAFQDDIYQEAFCVDPDYFIKTISKQDDKYCYVLQGKMVGTTFDGEIIWGWKLVDMMPRSEAEKNDYQYQPPPEGFAPEFTLTISDKTEQGGFIDLDKEKG